MKNKEILSILRDAKKLYITSSLEASLNPNLMFSGMCYNIYKSIECKNYNYTRNDIYKIIPELNSEFLDGDYKRESGFWWNLSNTEARIEAFDKLINLYEYKVQHSTNKLLYLIRKYFK